MSDLQFLMEELASVRETSVAAQNGDFAPTIDFFNRHFNKFEKDEAKMLMGEDVMEKLFLHMDPKDLDELLPKAESMVVKAAMYKAVGTRMLHDIATDCLRKLREAGVDVSGDDELKEEEDEDDA